MKVQRHIALVGFMGCGKSTVGSLVARRLKMRYVDLDQAIIERHGSIEAIFEREGEAGFRLHEYEALQAVLASESAIISTGGGVVTYEPSRLLLREITTIYLEASPESIAQRLRRSNTVRPLMGSKPNVAKVRELYEMRRPLYAEATYRIDAEREVNAVIASVLGVLKK